MCVCVCVCVIYNISNILLRSLQADLQDKNKDI